MFQLHRAGSIADGFSQTKQLLPSSPHEPWATHDASRHTSSNNAMNPNSFNVPAQPMVNPLDAWHRTLAEQSNHLFAQTLNRQLVDFDPMHDFALLPQIQPPAGRVFDWLYVGNKKAIP